MEDLNQAILNHFKAVTSVSDTADLLDIVNSYLAQNPEAIHLFLAKGACLIALNRLAEGRTVLEHYSKFAGCSTLALDLLDDTLPNWSDQPGDLKMDVAEIKRRAISDIQISAKEYCQLHNQRIIKLNQLNPGSVVGEIEIYLPQNIILAGFESAYLTPQGQLLSESSFYTNAKAALDSLTTTKICLNYSDQLPGTYLPLCGVWFNNFWHWMLEYAQSLLLARESGIEFKVIVQRDGRKFITESLEILDVPQADLVVNSKRYVWVEKLLLPQRITSGGENPLTPRVLELVREKVLAKVSPPKLAQPKRVYISRRDAAKRLVANEAELVELLSKYNVESVAMSDLSLRQQVELAANTDCLIAPHGAGMSHALFMPHGSLIVEIFAHDYVNPCMIPTMALLGHRYQMLVSPEHTPGDAPGNLRVDLQAIERILKQNLA